MINAKKIQSEDSKPLCKYGSLCYQKNKDHLQKFGHPFKTSRGSGKRATANRSSTVSLKQPNSERETKKEETHVPETLTSPASSAQQSDIETKTDTVNECLKEQDAVIDECLSSTSPKQPNSEHETVSEEEKRDTAERRSNSNSVTPQNPGQIIKDLFLVDMPEDFYSFWEFCKHLCPLNPTDALESINLKLVGPFDVLSGALTKDNVDKVAVLRHWRYYYDPPEFQTVIKSSNEHLFHIGYFRDDPKELPVFVGCNYAAKDSHILSTGENLFGALEWYLKQSEKTSNPFKKVKLSNLKPTLHNWAKKHNFALEKRTAKMASRDKNAVSKTFQQVGVVVPYNKTTELGYRPLSETPSDLRKLLAEAQNAKTKEERAAALDKLYTVVNWANIAADEGDFGTNLELGLDLFSFGSDIFDNIILQSLGTAYSLLNRQAFNTIIKSHLEDRRKGDNLSVIKEK